MVPPLSCSLSPSRISTYTSCALAFRFSSIERLPEPPTIWTAKGTLVHRALERLFSELESGQRTEAVAIELLHGSVVEILDGEEYKSLELAPQLRAELITDSERLVRNEFRLNDVNAVNAVGLELMVEGELGDLRLRGIIDRLDRRDDGELVVVDYKTGRAPGPMYERGRLAGVQFYAMLCEQMFGVRPAEIRLHHLSEPVIISAIPDDQSLRALGARTSAVWTAVKKACETENFKPNPSKLCDYCSFKAFCPAFGGDPDSARESLLAVG